MPKLSKRKLQDEEVESLLNDLWDAFTLAETKSEIRQLFKELCTHTEELAVAKRFGISRRLLAQEKYEKIKIDLKVTEHTIANVSNILNTSGAGLRMACEKVDNLESERLRKEKQKTDSISHPWKSKARRTTVLGSLMKAGIDSFDEKFSKAIKKSSTKKRLPL